MITEQARKRMIRSFANDRAKAWVILEDFVNRRCKPKKDHDNILDELSVVVYRYVDLNIRIYNWCLRNRVDVADFLCDVCNCDSKGIKLRNKETKNGKES